MAAPRRPSGGGLRRAPQDGRLEEINKVGRGRGEGEEGEDGERGVSGVSPPCSGGCWVWGEGGVWGVWGACVHCAWGILGVCVPSARSSSSMRCCPGSSACLWGWVLWNSPGEGTPARMGALVLPKGFALLFAVSTASSSPLRSQELSRLALLFSHSRTREHTREHGALGCPPALGRGSVTPGTEQRGPGCLPPLHVQPGSWRWLCW